MVACEKFVWSKYSYEFLCDSDFLPLNYSEETERTLKKQLHGDLEYGVLNGLCQLRERARDVAYLCLQQGDSFFTMKQNAGNYCICEEATLGSLKREVAWNQLVCKDWAKRGYCVVPCGIDVRSLGFKTVRERYINLFALPREVYGPLFDALKQEIPQTEGYLNKQVYYPAHIFALPAEDFERYYTWLFGMLSKLLSGLDTALWSEDQLRLPEKLAELLYGVYIEKLQREKVPNVVYSPSVHFNQIAPRHEYFPVFGKEAVTVVLTASDYFSPYAAVTLQTLLDHSTPTHNYDVFIFSKDMSKANALAIESMTEGYPNFSVRIVNVSAYIPDFSFRTSAHFTVESYFRSMIPYVLSNFDKIIYCDSDLLWQKDCAELYGLDIGDHLMAGIEDPLYVGLKNTDEYLSTYNENVLGIHKDTPYINTGVIIMNLNMFRTLFSLEYILQHAADGNFLFCDQDCLNVLCEGHTMLLDARWNVMTDTMGSNLDVIKKGRKEIADSYISSRKDPYVVHYADAKKPWQQECSDLGYKFWEVARRTPLYENILYRMACDVFQKKAKEKKLDTAFSQIL